MRLLVCGTSQRGKTTVIKKIMKAIQKKHKHDILIIFTDYPDEFNDLETENHLVQILKKSQLNDTIDILTSEKDEEVNKVPKTVFIDDSTEMVNLKKSTQLQKILTQLRHINCNVIIATHYINSLPIGIKQQYTDFILFGGVSNEKLRMFWDQILSDYLYCTKVGKEYDWKNFQQQYNEFCQGSNLSPDDEKHNEIFHNYMTITLSTAKDATRKVLLNDFSIKNAM